MSPVTRARCSSKQTTEHPLSNGWQGQWPHLQPFLMHTQNYAPSPIRSCDVSASFDRVLLLLLSSQLVAQRSQAVIPHWEGRSSYRQQFSRRRRERDPDGPKCKSATLSKTRSEAQTSFEYRKGLHRNRVIKRKQQKGDPSMIKEPRPNDKTWWTIPSLWSES